MDTLLYNDPQGRMPTKPLSSLTPGYYNRYYILMVAVDNTEVMIMKRQATFWLPKVF